MIMINNTFDKGYNELEIRTQCMHSNEVMISFLAERGYLSNVEFLSFIVGQVEEK